MALSQPSMFAASQNLALQIICVLTVFQFVRWLRNRLARHSISYLPGPEKTDWLFGNLTDLHFGEVGVPHFSWQKKYGLNFKMNGLLGEQYYMTSDPKAIQHIYANANTFVRQTNSRELLEMLMGPGLVTVGGEAHKRQRRAMQPAFGIAQLKALFPVFVRHIEKLSNVMKRDIDGGIGRKTNTVNVYDYAVNVTLDIIGDAAFEYQFGALDNKQDDLREILHESSGSLGSGTKTELLIQFGLEWLPTGLITFLSHLPITKFAHLRAGGRKLSRVAEQLVKEKTDALDKGLEGGKDVMSLLVRANAKENQSGRLSHFEVISEIATITFAGHGTTANTLSFALWELSKNLDLQRRLREEINETWQRVRESGETEIGFDEYENMPLLVAFIKEVLRCHPIIFTGGRQALEDSVIPLSHPVTLKSGETVDSIPISKGQQIWINIPGYNRSPELFGEDAYEFNVDRWFDEKNKKISGQGVGIYSNLLTFAHGSRACIGWRFSVWETQMLLIELIPKFEFTWPKNGKKVCRTPATLMMPTIEGESHTRAALFLDVSVIGA